MRFGGKFEGLVGVKGRRSTMRKIMKKAAMNRRVSNLEALPGEVVAEIAARVVSSSLATSSVLNLVNMKLTCKLLHEAAKDKRVLRRVVLIDRSRNVGWWLYHRESRALVLNCAEAGNQMASCGLGMVEWYSMRKNEEGKLHLTAAAEKGCVEAMYALGILLLAEQGPSRAAGVEWLERAEKAAGGGVAGLIKSRKMTMHLLRNLWIADGLLQLQPWDCRDDKCGKLVKRDPTKGWWCEEDEEANRHFCSSLCRYIHEFNKFVTKV